MSTTTQGSASQTEETRRLVMAFQDVALHAEKPLTAETLASAYRKLLDPDFRFECKGRHPVGGVFNGVDAFVNGFVVPAMKMMTDISVHLDEIFCEGERGVALFHAEATGPTGLPYNNSYCAVFRVRNGKIVEETEYLDTELTHTAMFGMPYPCENGHVCIQP